jgi:hypothetical protein
MLFQPRVPCKNPPRLPIVRLYHISRHTRQDCLSRQVAAPLIEHRAMTYETKLCSSTKHLAILKAVIANMAEIHQAQIDLNP